MKCIKYTSNDVIERVTDAEAKRIVEAGAACYTKKQAWRAYRNANRKEEARVSAIENTMTLPMRIAVSSKREETKKQRRLERRKKREEQRREKYRRAA